MNDRECYRRGIFISWSWYSPMVAPLQSHKIMQLLFTALHSSDYQASFTAWFRNKTSYVGPSIWTPPSYINTLKNHSWYNGAVVKDTWPALFGIWPIFTVCMSLSRIWWLRPYDKQMMQGPGFVPSPFKPIAMTMNIYIEEKKFKIPSRHTFLFMYM